MSPSKTKSFMTITSLPSSLPRRIALPIGALILMLAAGGCGKASSDAATIDTSAPSSTGATAPMLVTVQEIIGRTATDLASFPADLHAKRRAVVAAEIAGRVATRHVEEGSRVRRGAPILTLDTRDLQQRVAEAEAVDRQRALQLERAQALMERRSITNVQLLDALTARDVAAAQLAAARLQLEKAKIAAPWTGTVSEIHPEAGDFLSPGSSVAVLLDTSTLEARATVPSSDVPFLKVGMEAEVSVDVAPGHVFAGRVVRLGAELDPRTRTLDAIIEIPGPTADARLRPGSAAEVRVARQILENAVIVPLGAVIELESGHVAYVVSGDGEGSVAEQREVSLGPVIGADRVVIDDGLAAGDLLVVEGQQRLSPDQPVAVAAPRTAESQED